MSNLPNRDEEIAFESARECISHVIAILSCELFGPAANSLPPERVNALKDKLAYLASVRQQLRMSDTLRINRIREEFGRFVRRHMEAPNNPADLGSVFLD